MAWSGAANGNRSTAFWRPGTTGPGSTLDRDSTDAEGGVVVCRLFFTSKMVKTDNKSKIHAVVV